MADVEEKNKIENATFEVKEAQTKDFLVPSSSPLPHDIESTMAQTSSVSLGKVSELIEAIDAKIEQLDLILNDLVDQTEEQILQLKSSILAVDHLLPEDRLENSKVILMNTSFEEFLSQFSDEESMEGTKIGYNIRASHIFSNLASVDGVHGVFLLYPMGSADAKEASEHYNALTNIARLANRNMFQVYYEVNIPKIAYKVTQDGKIQPLEKYSELMERHRDITQWINDYRSSAFYRKFNEGGNPKWLRRLTALFNPYVGNTETLESYYRCGKIPNDSFIPLIDRVPWISPVSVMAGRLVRNYERLGWCGGLFGLLNTARQIPEYANPSPQLLNNGLSFSQEMGYRYGLTLYNFLLDRQGQELMQLSLTPLQRQIRGSKEEWLAFIEAQTMLPQPENFDERTTPEQFKELSNLKKEEFLAKATQKMYNYLGNSLMEDTICRGIILLCKKFIGSVSGKEKTVANLKETVKDYMTIFAGKPGLQGVDPYNTYEPALDYYEIKDINMSGSTASVTVSIRPVQALRKVVLLVDTNPLDFELSVDQKKLSK